MTVLLFVSITVVCMTILCGMTLYFNHKEKIEKIKLESNKED